MSNRPLNPLLYQQLQRRFGTVRTSHEGQAMSFHYERDKNGRKALVVVDPGEYYQVCCPHCNDTRFRLWINHRWGVRDKQTGSRGLWLAVCYNEGCFDSHEKLELLLESLGVNQKRLETAIIQKGEVAQTNRQILLPGPVTRLDTLPAEHPANSYLAGRFYDPIRLGRFYGVGYCEESNLYLARRRIIAPVYMGGHLRGWQARYVGEMDWKAPNAVPKWWTCPGMHRASLLYNLDQASKFQTGVIVEGPADVWAFGPMAVSCFGSTMTREQQNLFIEAFKDRSAVLLFDADVMDKPVPKAHFEKLCGELQGHFRRGFAPVILPEGTDPGDFDRGFLRGYTAYEAKKLGVEVNWNRR